MAKKKQKKIEYNSKFFSSMILLIIMVLSIAGFAMISAGPSSSSNSKKQDVPLQYFDQYGVWAAILNNQQFVFKDINQYQNNLILDSIANKIKSQKELNIYYDTNTYDGSSIFLLEKALKALKIDYTLINNPSCNKANNLLLLYNNSNQTINGNCIKFISSEDDVYNQTNGLVYYLIK